MRRISASVIAIGAAALIGLSAPASAADAVAAAKEFIAKVTAPNPPWDGPTTGPKAQTGKSIVYASADQRNGGALGVGQGVEEAAKILGWKFTLIDGHASISGRSEALSQAIALKPDGIILGTIDAKEQQAAIEEAVKQGIKVVGWHSTGGPGPSDSPPLFTNITTDPLQVAAATASYAIAESDGKAGVVIFTDSIYAIAIRKSDEMARIIKECSTCTLLSVEDTPLSDVTTRMPQLTTSLLQRFGDKWTYAFGINDLYFDFMAPSLASAGIGGEGAPHAVSAGDGSEVAFQRIRTKQYQVGTVAEPLRLHGWQAVDEMNRALAGEPPSGYVAPAHLFLPSNIDKDGGPKNTYDPENGYQDAYKKIWGVQ
jgi:ribose transport system substrate-binding protein